MNDIIRTERARLRREVEALPHWDMGNGEIEVGAQACNWHAVLKLLADDPDLPAGFAYCSLCGEPEHVEDIDMGVCITCADAVTFGQHARRASIELPIK